jgi:hypothetical protein
MNDLTRRRNARDIWISRGHLIAGACLAVTMSATSFGLGFVVGRDVPEERSAAVAEPAIPDAALLELLARVESSATLDGAVDVLTFPDALRGEPGGAPSVPEAPAPSTAAIRIAAPTDAGRSDDAPQPVRGDAPPAGAFTVVVGRGEDLAAMRALQAKLGGAGLTAWIGAEIVDGVAGYRVAVGGYPTAEAASAALPIVHAAGLPGTVERNP